MLRSEGLKGPSVLTSRRPLGRRRAEMLTSYNRADDGLRTRDLQLGKLALYQLSYARVRSYSITPDAAHSQP
jgi:hypothetical protein